MNNETKINRSGIGLCESVFLVFLVLKLAEIGVVANWSWWWVIAPIWMPLICVLLIGVIYSFFVD